MAVLSETQRRKAVDYIKAHARPLEQALYAYHFESGPLEAVLGELAQFQNPDGGFGRALEPDTRLDESSVLATTVAFQHFRELGVPAEHPLVQAGARYLLDSYDPEQHVWQIIPPNIDDAAHAPWWEYSGDPAKMRANPRAEILGYLYDYPQLFPAELREALTSEQLEYGASQHEIEMHELLCYVRLVETKALPAELRKRFLAFVRPAVEHTVGRDPAKWGEYGLTPLTVVSSPRSLFFPDFADLIPLNIARDAAAQSEEGFWQPPWSWAFASEAGWQAAERDLRGVFTLSNLLAEKRFGQ
ncbi:MAG TPA: hypothetical protein VFS21_04225 [Roseiflexaceae bacterium]|nr:hypothetical protein [Roseiflexaceae bacterium]